MAKLWLITISTLLLTGCAVGPNSTGSLDDTRANEVFLEQSNNYPRLVEHYKDQLKQKDSLSTRVKLAQVYIDLNDNESALFTLASVIAHPKADGEVFYLQGVAQYRLGKLQQALRSLEVSVQKSPDDARSINMLGVTQAELGMLNVARQSFNRARELMYDDVVVKNNLALLDMIEGDFKQAAERLMPIYINTPSKVDAKLKANLAIIVSKLGSFESLKSLYGDKYSETQLFDIFQSLRASEPATRVSDTALAIKSKDLPLATESKLVIKTASSSYQAEGTQPTLADEALLQSNSSSKLPKDMKGVPQDLESLTENSPSSQAKARSAALNQEMILDPSSIESPSPEVPSSVFLSQVKPMSKDVSNSNSVLLDEKEVLGVERHYSRSSLNIGGESLKTSNMPQEIAASTSSSDVSNNANITDKQGFANDILGVDRTFGVATHVDNANSIRADQPQEQQAFQGVDSPLASSLEVPQKKQPDAVKKWNFVPLSSYDLKAEGGLNIPLAQFRHHGNLIDITLDSDATVIAVE